MSEAMNIQVNPHYLAESIPVWLECFVIIGFTPLRKKEDIRIRKMLQSAAFWVKRSSLGVDILIEHPGCFRGKANDFDPSFPAPFAECCSLLAASSLSPIAYGQSKDFPDTCS